MEKAFRSILLFMHTVLGPIVRLQVQRSPMKTGEKPHRRYDTAPLVTVQRLRVTDGGSVGLVNGLEVLDVHHRAHSATRNDRPEKALSIGFTGHYQEMRERYGEHMAVGCAGENVIVDTRRRVPLEEISGGLVILAGDGTERVRLNAICVANPCKPFAGFAHAYQMVDPEILKATLQFLMRGTRGFRCVPETNTEIAVGDLLATIG